ncbi:putative fatty acyl-CoA reductase CG8306 [Frankliniella occidentalis]|uniref:Fatty acyl-CoA reductase n=1 Tax=Frankliniella occidentalis TaxID=133901 RepID=A0A9C6XC69_FRAOC|nr:putative fatty acyl-CoA reductase CG8306 [Frankliniella occidentalis]
MPSAVADFYKGADVLVTGATGFVGVALLEKLLRSCPDVGNIYCLMRPKRGKDISVRAEEFPKNLVFEKLIEKQGSDVFKKIIPVAGEIGEENLGLSPEDRKTLQANVQVAFHCAATLDFEANLKTTVTINLLGTRRIVELCSGMKKLKALVHVSSAYVNSNLKVQVDEKLYPVPDSADKIIEMASSLSDAALEEATPKVLGNHPNTYTFTKALAEHEVAKGYEKFPAVVVRPSMITCAWKEPVPGWINSKNGPSGFFMGAAKGVVRRLPVGKELVYDYIPVDVVVNEMLVSAWHTATNKPKEMPVYHITSSTCNPFRWATIENRIPHQLDSLPLKAAVWYPTLKLLPSLTLFRISAIFVHFLPAYFFDALTVVAGGRPILVRLHTNVSKSLARLAPFIFQEWFFDNKRTLELHESLSPADKEAFGLDIRSIQWNDYFEHMHAGVRRYLNNEEPKTLPAARKKHRTLYILNILVQIGFLSTIWFGISRLLGMTMTSTIWLYPILYFLFNLL